MRKDILKLIDKNSKMSTNDIAAMLNMSEDKVKAEICAMEADQVICGYPTLINWDKVDDEEAVTALIEVKVTPQRGDGFERIAERIYKFEEVEAVYLMSGTYDLTVIIQGKTMREVSIFVSGRLATMESVMSTGTHFILKKYKEHGIALCDTSKDERMLITP
jgi:DNA-binding Lrp family transcriptional regulator